MTAAAKCSLAVLRRDPMFQMANSLLVRASGGARDTGLCFSCLILRLTRDLVGFVGCVPPSKWIHSLAADYCCDLVAVAFLQRAKIGLTGDAELTVILPMLCCERQASPHAFVASDDRSHA